MKKTGILALLLGLAFGANAQLTAEQVAEKMRPEYKVDLSTLGKKTTPTAPTLSRATLEEEIKGLEMQNAKLDQMTAEHLAQSPTATVANDATLRKYSQAKTYNLNRIEDRRKTMNKLPK